MRVEVLFKEYPWLRSLHPKISNATTFNVSRVDVETLNEFVGVGRRGNSILNNRGWFIDSEGKVIDQIHFPGTSLVNTICFLTSPKFGQSIKDAALNLTEMDEVKYIVIIDFYEQGFFALSSEVWIKFIKIPTDKTLRELVLQSNSAKTLANKVRDEEEMRRSIEELNK